MRKVVVITGAGAGVGRATAEQFARAGWDMGLISRDRDRLTRAAQELQVHGGRALVLPADVADAAAVDAAAEQAERELGPIEVWVNAAMATVFSPVAALTPEELARATAVTYLGQAHGIMAALRHMRPRNRGGIICVGSALAYRSIPLQAAYCGAKAAIRGFIDSLRSELIHDRLAITVTEVDLPAVNTPQFDWARNKMPRRPQPVPPIFEPEVPARAILFAALHPRRQIWVGFPTVKAILANRIAPAWIDRYLATAGYTGQLSAEPALPDAPDNLFAPVPGPYGARGRFSAVARADSWAMFTSRHRDAAWAMAGAALVASAIGALARARREPTADEACKRDDRRTPDLRRGRGR
jgi:short-subunit dehydrogenase